MRDQQSVVLHSGRATWPEFAREVWAHRELTLFFAWRDIKVRYRQAALGLAWAVVRPVLLAVVFTLVFQRVGQLEVPGTAPYALFALTGLVAWTYFASAVLSASESVVGNSNLVSKVHFPRLTMPLSALCAILPDLVVGLALLSIGLVITTTPVGWDLALLPVALATLLVAAFGVGAWLAALNVKYRDVRQFTPFMMQVGLFVSPVIYASTSLPGPAQVLSAVNPVAAPIDLLRAALLDAPLPETWRLLCSAAVSLFLALTATEYFRRKQHLFADVI